MARVECYYDQFWVIGKKGTEKNMNKDKCGALILCETLC
jgi:hypothetical protein